MLRSIITTSLNYEKGSPDCISKPTSSAIKSNFIETVMFFKPTGVGEVAKLNGVWLDFVYMRYQRLFMSAVEGLAFIDDDAISLK